MKFIKLDFNRRDKGFGELVGDKYIVPAIELLFLNRHALFDDFLGLTEENRLQKGIALIAHYSPYFWAIVDRKTEELAGVVYLYNVVGTPKNPYSAHVSVCFHKKYWGKFVAKSAKKFFKYVFGKLALRKVFAEIYSDNKLGRFFVRRLGFAKSSLNLAQTIRGGIACATITYVKFHDKKLQEYFEKL